MFDDIILDMRYYLNRLNEYTNEQLKDYLSDLSEMRDGLSFAIIKNVVEYKGKDNV